MVAMTKVLPVAMLQLMDLSLKIQVVFTAGRHPGDTDGERQRERERERKGYTNHRKNQGHIIRTWHFGLSSSLRAFVFLLPLLHLVKHSMGCRRLDYVQFLYRIGNPDSPLITHRDYNGH